MSSRAAPASDLLMAVSFTGGAVVERTYSQAPADAAARMPIEIQRDMSLLDSAILGALSDVSLIVFSDRRLVGIDSDEGDFVGATQSCDIEPIAACSTTLMGEASGKR